VAVDPVVGRSPIALTVERGLRGRLVELGQGQALVIDYYSSWHRGFAVGDLTVRFGEPKAEPRYVALEPLEGVNVLAERSLLGLLDGATIREAGLPFARHLAISLERPEMWIEFLQQHPARRAK
jgi:hypothetical protein